MTIYREQFSGRNTLSCKFVRLLRRRLFMKPDGKI